MNRILVVRLGSLGDIVHAIPAVAALRSQWPHAQLDWATSPVYRDLVAMVDGVDHVVPVDTRALFGSSGLLTAIGRLRASRYDAVLDLQGLLKSAVLARLAGGQRTLGYARPDLREPAAAAFYSHATDVSEAGHVIDKALRLMRAIGCKTSDRRFPISVPDIPEVTALAKRLSSSGYALLNPGAAWPNKRWPVDKYGVVAARLKVERGMTSVVLWGPGERARAEAVVAASEGAAEVAPPTTIPAIAALAQQARLIVSGDTGPLQLALAVGTPAVALFGPTRAERNGPWASQDISISRVDRCECVHVRQCRRSESCINTIGVDEALSAVATRLDRAGAEGPG